MTQVDGLAAGAAPLARPRLRFVTKVLYASGSVGNAIKKGGLAAFLLIYYNQVVGLDAAAVAAVLAFAVVLDGIYDPIVGYWSDHVRSRLGRRHPFMYASILPVSLGFACLWMAPANWSETHLLIYMAVLVLVVRFFDTFFEVPTAALLAELSQDYDERTAIASMRFIMGILGAFAMRMLVYGVLLAPTVADASGITNREGFAAYGMISGVVIFVAILACCLGTHGQIKYLHMPKERQHSLISVFKEIYTILSNRSMLAVVGAALFLTIGLGAMTGLQIYFKIYLWGITTQQIALIVPFEMVGAVLGAVAAMHISRGLGKRNAAILALVTSYLGISVPLYLRFAGLTPAPGSSELIVLLGMGGFVMEGGRIVFSVLASSMMLDLVEDSQRRTGRRSEGLILSADNVLQKAVAGLGIFTSGLILTVANFPRSAAGGAVPIETLDALASTVLIGLTPLYIAAALCLLGYTIDRRRHESNVAALSTANVAEARE